MSRIWPLYSETELGNVPQPKWLVQGHLTDGFSVLYGPPKSGKTFLALDWALRIATRTDWHGHTVIGGPVLYVSGEGAGGLHSRIRAWHTANATDTTKNATAVPAHHRQERYATTGNDTVQNRTNSRHSGACADVTTERARATRLESFPMSTASADDDRAIDRCVDTRW